MLLEKQIAGILTSRKKTLSVAESCSGGLVSHRLTNVPGSSKFFKMGLIAYHNAIKTEVLKVSKSLIATHGAVSQPVACKMAENIRKIAKTDFGIGITGIAGPAGGTKAKPVGLVFIAVANKSGVSVKKFIFAGNRLAIKSRASEEALRLLLKMIS